MKMKIVDKILRRTSETNLRIGDNVRIHPKLETDPYNKRGKYGRIVNIMGDKEGDYKIKFPDGKIGVYQYDTVLRVK